MHDRETKTHAGNSGSVVGYTSPPPTPSISPPLSLPSPKPQLAAEDGFSESSWDQDQRQITADVYAKCNMETPQLCPHY